jgi:hypothetical protein
MNRTTPIRELKRYLEFGYEEFLYSKLTPSQIREYLLKFVEGLESREERLIKDSFLFGYDCSGKCDNPELLADVFYNSQFKERRK